jgi:hypothetical protein
VLVGVVGLELDRRPFYFKECEFVVSCSYGPGRYDADYEERGRDYPAAYVRWTEQRNIQAVLDLMGAGRLDVAPLISHRFAIDRVLDAYQLIEQGSSRYLGVLLEYEGEQRTHPVAVQTGGRPTGREGRIGAGVIGTGNFARMVLLPVVTASGQFEPRLICSSGGLSAASTAPKFGFPEAVPDEAEVIGDDRTESVFVLTRHADHARQVAAALKARKHVFVEKPLVVTEEELAGLEDVLADMAPLAPVLTVGFNRRFS